MLTHKILWQVSLSNGETFQEGKGKFEEIQGDLSPWQRLLGYLQTQELHITSLSLIDLPSGSVHNLPSMGKNPNFEPFRKAQKPLFYGMNRCIATEANWDGVADPESSQVREWYTVAKAVYPEYSLQIWVSELDGRNSWILIEKN